MTATDLLVPTLASLFDSRTEGIIYFRAVRDDVGLVIDFSVAYSNPAIDTLAQNHYQVSPGMSLRHSFQPIMPLSRHLFADMCQVLETGQSLDAEYPIPDRQQRVLVSQSKADDGVLSLFRVVTEKQQDQHRADLQAVIDNAQTGIFVISPVLDDQGRHTDFRFETINRMVTALVGQTPESVRGSVVSDWFTNYRQTGLFDQYKHTWETGEAQHFTIHYNVDGFDVWFDVKAIKLGQEVMVTFSDYTDLKQAQQAVERQAELLNSVLDGSANGIMAFESVRDSNGHITDFALLMTNEAGAKLVNRSASDLPGQRLLSLFPATMGADVFQNYVHTTETGEPTHAETSYNVNGLEVWLDISTRQARDGFVSTFSDISAIKQGQQTVEQAAAELRAVIDSAQAAIALMRPVYDSAGEVIDFRFRMANQMLAAYVHQEPATLIGGLKSTWFPAYCTNGLFERYQRVYTTGQTQHFSLQYQADSFDAWINVTASRFGDDVLVTFSDFSDLKRLQEQLEASATELQTIIDTSQTGIFLFSPVRDEQGEVVDFRFQVANQQLASYVGQQPEAVTGTLGSTWFPDYQTNGLFETYRKAYLSGEPQRFDFHYDGSGIDVWLDIMATKMGDEVLVTFGDYTPLKRLQQQLESSVKELQRSNENLEQFAYVASHDLQEPLRKILAFGDIIQNDYAPIIGGDGADLIQRMQSAASRMQMLIKDVLAYSRVATKREAIRQVDLNAVIADVLTDLETAITDRKASIQVSPLPTLPGDPLQLQQLFQNLLGNALKFARPTGTTADSPQVSVTTRRVQGSDAGWPLPSADANRFFHCIDVLDNGIGFDPQQAERIFQVFQRLHGRSDYQGTGIGLAIVKKVVDNHQGYIRAEGRPGQGATFRVLLPE